MSLPKILHHQIGPQGAIEFDNASLAYRPGLPLVLKNLNFKINPMEKLVFVEEPVLVNHQL